MFYISLFCTIAVVGTFFYLFVIAVSKFILKDKIEKFNFKLSLGVVFMVLISLLIYGLVVIDNKIDNPIVNEGAIDYSGTLGDLIGGVLNPILALFGILAGGLAFYAQYQANKQVQDQFRIQQFESQFYEMLHLHRENLNEMKIDGYEYNDEMNKNDKQISGKKIFVSMLNEFESCFQIILKSFKKSIPSVYKYDNEIFFYAYYIFFFGLEQFEREMSKFAKNDNIPLNDFEKAHKKLKRAQLKHSTKGIKNYKNIKLYFNYKPFTGHQSRLAHYYRHLYQTVKYVVKQNEKIISYENKRDYLRILRSVLSNQEQVLLFYNWHSDFGYDWEQKDIEKRKNKFGNYFFTDYRMIHNLSPHLLLNIFDNESIEAIFNENFRNFRFEENRKKSDTLFELINIPIIE